MIQLVRVERESIGTVMDAQCPHQTIGGFGDVGPQATGWGIVARVLVHLGTFVAGLLFGWSGVDLIDDVSKVIFGLMLLGAVWVARRALFG